MMYMILLTTNIHIYIYILPRSSRTELPGLRLPLAVSPTPPCAKDQGVGSVIAVTYPFGTKPWHMFNDPYPFDKIIFPNQKM